MGRSSTIRVLLLLLAFFIEGRLSAQTASLPQTTPSAGSYTISGTVVNKSDDYPLTRARIVIRSVTDSKNVYSMVTSEDGKFAFRGLPAGKYSLEGAKRGFIPAAYDQHDQFSTAIVTGAGLDTETLVLRLAPAAMISGKILDEGGDPVQNAAVMLYRYDHSQGMGRIRRFRGVQTDDQGSYEITPLMPGTYFLSASATPWYAVHPPASPTDGQSAASNVDRSLDVAYPLTYYPDVTDSDSATPILLRGGDRVQIDIHLNPVPALHLLVHVPETVNGGFAFPQLEASAFDGPAPVQSGEVRVVSPGVIEISGVPAGKYNIRLHGAGRATQMLGVEISSDSQQIESSSSESLSTVGVSVSVPGEAKVPPDLFVGLRSSRRAAVEGQMVKPDGKAEFEQIAPGTYEILAWGSDRTYAIGQISAQGAAVRGHTLTLTAGSSPTLRLTLVAGTTQVHGTAKRAGKPFAGAMVVLVPANPEVNHDLFRRDQSDQDGTFTLRDVAPGSYTAVAIQDGWDLDWSKPGVMAAYLKHGETIEISSRNGRNVELPEAVEVQAKQ